MKCGDEFSLSPENFFFGVNMAIRKEVLTRFGFHPELVGKRNDGDGEWGFLREMKDAGMLIGYCPLALVHHLIPHRRMSIKFIRKWADHHAASATFAEYWQQSIKRFTIARDAFSCAMQVVRSAYKFLRCYHRTEPWAIDLTYRHCYQKRRFLYLVRVMLDTKLRRLLRQPNFSPF